MGTPCAVVFANIYMYITFDKRLLEELGPSVLLYGRFIDDIFIVTSQTTTDSLHRAMNETNPTITLSITSSPCRSEFLDLVICKWTRFDQKAILDLATHQKEFNLYLYIPCNSFHTRAMKKSFIQTELRRYIRNSSSQIEFERICAAFFHRLRNRGYPKAFLVDVFTSVSYLDRPRFLAKSAPPKHCDFPLLFKTTYTPLSASIRIKQILTEHWNLLDTTAFPHQPIVCYKRTANLSGLLCNAKS